jgi:hypothetical protein
MPPSPSSRGRCRLIIIVASLSQRFAGDRRPSPLSVGLLRWIPRITSPTARSASCSLPRAIVAALDHFARTYDLRRGDDRSGIAAKSLEYANQVKLLHDAQQFRYLARTHRGVARFEALARSYEAVSRHFPAAVTKLSESDRERLRDTYNRVISVRDAPESAEGAVAVRPDREQLLREFRGRNGMVSFDDLLTPHAFATLRRYLLESTIWHDFSRIKGFVASYLEDGLACPLLLQGGRRDPRGVSRNCWETILYPRLGPSRPL